MSTFEDLEDNEAWQVYIPRWKRRTIKKTEAAKQTSKVRKTEKELVADLIEEINSGLDVKKLTTHEINLLEKKLGNDWFEIFGFTENPISQK